MSEPKWPMVLTAIFLLGMIELWGRVPPAKGAPGWESVLGADIALSGSGALNVAAVPSTDIVSSGPAGWALVAWARIRVSTSYGVSLTRTPVIPLRCHSPARNSGRLLRFPMTLDDGLMRAASQRCTSRRPS